MKLKLFTTQFLRNNYCITKNARCRCRFHYRHRTHVVLVPPLPSPPPTSIALFTHHTLPYFKAERICEYCALAVTSGNFNCDTLCSHMFKYRFRISGSSLV